MLLLPEVAAPAMWHGVQGCLPIDPMQCLEAATSLCLHLNDRLWRMHGQRLLPWAAAEVERLTSQLERASPRRHGGGGREACPFKEPRFLVPGR